MTSSLFAATALAGYGLSGAWLALLAATVVLGLAGGLIDAGINAYMAMHHGARVMNLLHASFGLGATLGPLLMTVAVTGFDSWRGGYLLLAAVQLALGAGFWATRERWQRAPARDARARRPRSGRPAVLAAGLIVFFIYTGVEVAAGQWAFTLFSESRGWSEASAGLLVGGYWGVFTAGRVVTGLAGNRVPLQPLVSGATAGVAAGVVLLWWSPADWVGAAGLLLAAAALAPIFPTLTLLTPQRLGTEYTPWAVGYQLAAAALGAAAIPGAIGVLVAVSGLEAIGWGLALAALALMATGAALRRLAGTPVPAAT